EGGADGAGRVRAGGSGTPGPAPGGGPADLLGGGRLAAVAGGGGGPGSARWRRVRGGADRTSGGRQVHVHLRAGDRVPQGRPAGRGAGGGPLLAVLRWRAAG